MTKAKKILEHPDRDEVISKIVIGTSNKDIHEWLKCKYTNPNERKFILSEMVLKDFQDNYLDIYNFVKQDIVKTKSALANNAEDELKLAVQNSSAYKNKMLELADEKIDIKKIITNLAVAIESRFAQVFDAIQEDPRNINTRIDRLSIEYAETLGNILEKYHKFAEAPADMVVQHNVTLQVVDQHITVFHDVIKEVLSNMDVDTSLRFIEVFNEKMSKLKMPEAGVVSPDMRLADAKLLSETISKKINE
jgi:hypothetical protein